MRPIEYVELSEDDLKRIVNDLYPKSKRMLVWTSMCLLGLSIIGPYIPGRFADGALIEITSYPKAFLVCLGGFTLFGFYIYWKSVRGLRADWKNGQKCVFKTEITRKIWKGHKEFELFLDAVPKVFRAKKFIYPALESDNFHQGEIIVLEYLEQSGILLRTYAET